MNKALVDTDILSFYFKGDLKVEKHFCNYLEEFDQINISIITYFEIIGGLKFKGANKQIQIFDEFVMNNRVIHITESSARIAGEIYADLRKLGITIGTSDLLIAGIAVENELALVTNNEKHYEQISKLNIENWRK